MRVFGTTLAPRECPSFWDIAILTACLFWLVSKLSNQIAAAFASFTFLAFVTLGDTAVVANHRWDSSAWAVLAVTLIIAAADSKRSSAISFAAGIAVAIAAWCTPPVALAVAALGACLVAYRDDATPVRALCGRRCGRAGGGANLDRPTGSASAMLDSLLWSASNYSGANRVWYGSVTGGYANLLHGTSATGCRDHDRAAGISHLARDAAVLERDLAVEASVDERRHPVDGGIRVDSLDVSSMGSESSDVGFGAVLRARCRADCANVIQESCRGDCADRCGIVLHGQHPTASP